MEASANRETLHELKNHLGGILGVIELLVSGTPPDDERYADLVNIQNAVNAAIALLPRLEPDDPFLPRNEREPPCS